MNRRKRIMTALVAHTDLTARAFASLRNFLTNKAKSNPTEAQLKVLFALMDNLSRLAFKETTGRFAWALPVGCGKTTSACHFVAEAVKEGFSFVIACGQVSGLNDINDFLVHQLQVPQAMIGTMVSQDKLADVTGRCAFDGKEFPILLVTHARIHMGQDQLTRYWTYHGVERDLLIYDESLISSKSVITALDDIQSSFHNLRGNIQDGDIKVSDEFYRQVTDLIDVFRVAHKSLLHQVNNYKETHPTGTTIPSDLRYTTFELEPLDTDAFAEDVATITRYKWSEGLLRFLALCGTEVRLVVTDLGDSVLSFLVTVPEDIERMVILDASNPIRLLAGLDTKQRITMAETLPLVQAAGITNLAALYDYSNVTWHCYKAGGGRSSFKNDKQNLKIKDAVTLLKTIPADDAVLYFVFKRQGHDRREKDIERLLRGELIRQGYDLTSPKLCIETFGRETSSNSYKHCRHIIFVGTPWQNINSVIATMLGQKRDMNVHFEDSLIRDVELSEVAYRFHQGAGRGSMRVNGPDGRPTPMTVYSFLTDDQKVALMPFLQKVMPGMQTPDRRLQKHHQINPKQELLEHWLRQELKQAANPSHSLRHAASFRLSITAIKRGWKGSPSFVPLSIDTFTRALEKVLTGSSQWSKKGRSLVYRP